MNVRLADGTVRCADHFDASSYVSETDDPCLYCPDRCRFCGEECHPGLCKPQPLSPADLALVAEWSAERERRLS